MSKIEKISSMNKPHNKQKPKEKVNGKQQNDNEFQQRCEQYRHSLKVQIKDNDENTHYKNYMLFLKLIILIIIKINDDLCIKEDIEEKDKNTEI